MDFFNGIVALLTLVVLVLTVVVAWLYVQQSRILQAVSALAAAVTAPPPTFYEAVKEYPIPEEEPGVAEAAPPKEMDDRVSVRDDDEEEESSVEEQQRGGGEAEDDDLSGKTVAQLRELLNGKGIPFNKSDKKPILVNLLKAAS